MTDPAAVAAGLSDDRASEYLELADGLEHASRVAWRWLRDDASPWDREITLRMVERLSSNAQELRLLVRKAKGE